IKSPSPRVTARSCELGRVGRSGRRARLAVKAGRSLLNATSSSLSPEIARIQAVIARLKGSASTGPVLRSRELSPIPDIWPDMSNLTPHLSVGGKLQHHIPIRPERYSQPIQEVPHQKPADRIQQRWNVPVHHTY